MVWLSEQELNSTVLVEVKKSPRGNGYILKGKDFDAFLFNSVPILKHLLAAGASWCDIGQGKELNIVRNTKVKHGFDLVPTIHKNKEVLTSYRLTESGFTTLEDDSAPEYNPFL